MMMHETGSTVKSSSARIAVLSPWLVPFVGEQGAIIAGSVVLRPSAKEASQLTAVAGPGPGPLDDGAYAYAQRHQLPFLRVDVGVIAGAVSGKHARPWSVIVHPPCPPARALAPEFAPIEAILGQGVAQTSIDAHATHAAPTNAHATDLLSRAAEVRRRFVEQRLSRFADQFVDSFGSGETFTSVTRDTGLVVVVVPPRPTFGSNGESVVSLVEAARKDHPNAPIALLLETELFTGQIARVPDAVATLPKVFALPVDVDRAWLLERAKSVYTFDSTFGFEALLHGVTVAVFGTPFYGGWGLTLDRGPSLERPRTSTLDELVAATLIIAPNYWDPVRQCPTTVKETLEHLALQKGIYLENRGRFLCIGFSLWKRVILRSYLTSKGNEIAFLRDAKQLSKVAKTENTKIVHWASRPHDEVAQWAQEQGVPLWRLEDGFLRSVGLGSDWSAPGSLVFDSEGIYYDPREPSRLETLLLTAEFRDEELAEAEALIAQIVSLRISKYNTQSDREFVPRNPQGQKVVFVPGQVADDASVRFGASQIGSVSRLLETVRKLCPDAYILYKPHPDVLSGNRRGHVNEGLGTWFDELVLDVSIARCLDHVNEVHTMSSLVGFEALLRNIPVTCHGQPFYSGWGLTQDRAPIARRQRKLTLPMLVSCTLMRYPRYFHFLSGNFCSAAQMADFLAAAQRTGQLPRKQPKLLRRLRSLIELTKAIKHAG